MSRTLRSTSVKSVRSCSRATAASRLFVACLSNWLKKKLFFGIRERRMDILLVAAQKETAPAARSRPIWCAFRQRTVAAAPVLRDLATDRRDGADSHHHAEHDEDADV